MVRAAGGQRPADCNQSSLEGEELEAQQTATCLLAPQTCNGVEEQLIPAPWPRCRMFYLLDLKKELEIQPRFFGPKLQQEVERRLRQEVEGTCDGQYGFILAVVAVEDFGKGKIREGVGSAVFNIAYKCIAFMPHKGEVLDVVVSSVNKMGFFAEAGPLQVFVSNHLIPEDFEFSSAGDPCYITADGEQRITPGAEVRLRVVGTRIDANDIFAVGDLSADYLGLISAAV